MNCITSRCFRLGTSEGLDDIIVRYHVSSKGNVTHSILELLHGSLVCGQVECINHVGLVSNAYIPCQHIITKSPNTSNCDIVMTHTKKWGVPEPESLYDVTDDIIFAVDGMDYQPDLYTYTFDVTSNNTKILNGREMICNYAHFNGLPGGDYQINVQATNTLGYTSNAIRQNVTRYGSIPTLTGQLHFFVPFICLKNTGSVVGGYLDKYHYMSAYRYERKAQKIDHSNLIISCSY